SVPHCVILFPPSHLRYFCSLLIRLLSCSTFFPYTTLFRSRCVIWTWFWCCTAVIASLGGRKGTKEPQRDGECYFFLLFCLRCRGRRNGVWPVSTFIWLRHYLYCGCVFCYDRIYL